MSGDSFLLELAPQGEPSLYLRTMGGTGRGICLYGHYSPRLFKVCLMDGVWPDDGTERYGCLAWQLYCL